MLGAEGTDLVEFHLGGLEGVALVSWEEGQYLTPTPVDSFRPTVPENSGNSATYCTEVAFPSTECKELGESLASQDSGHFVLKISLSE